MIYTNMYIVIYLKTKPGYENKTSCQTRDLVLFMNEKTPG